MAQVAVAAAAPAAAATAAPQQQQQPNGVVANPPAQQPQHHRNSPPSSSPHDTDMAGLEPVALPAKRKRDHSPANDDASETSNKTARIHSAAIQDYFDLLERLDDVPSVLKRPLDRTSASPLQSSDEQPPQPKLQKTAGGDANTAAITIAKRVARDEYGSLEDMAGDIVAAADAQVAQLRSNLLRGGDRRLHLHDEAAISHTERFKARALEYLARESAYPAVPMAGGGGPSGPSGGGGGQGEQQQPLLLLPQSSLSGDNFVLTAYGNAPQGRQLFSSLPARDATAEALSAARAALVTRPIPPGLSATRALPSHREVEQIPTLGELFRSPNSLPPLQPPKPRAQPKGNVLALQEREPWWTGPQHLLRGGSGSSSIGGGGVGGKTGGTYFTTKLSVGNYLDYGNAIPVSPGRTRQRERAQSLAGVRPSLDELEMSEMDTLFRRGFSSFAPCKDDSGAVLPAGTGARLWWRKVGRRGFDRLIEAERSPGAAEGDGDAVEGDGGEEVEGDREEGDQEAHEDDRMAQDEGHDGDEAEFDPHDSFDEKAILKALEEWDDSLVDPSLEAAMGKKKSDEDQDMDDRLQEVTDLIETLSSHQRIRNLVLPSSQTRAAGAPVNTDMLAHGSMPQPSDEETATYRRLKDRLASIIAGLPPYAVAKLGGHQLGALLVDAKLEVLTSEYYGVMEDEESAALAQTKLRQQQQQVQQVQQAQQQAQQAQQVQQAQQHIQMRQQASTPVPRPVHRPGSVSVVPYPVPPYTPQQRTPVLPPQQPQQPQPAYYRPAGAAPAASTPIPRPLSTPGQQQQHQPLGQYGQPNGYANLTGYSATATAQLAKVLPQAPQQQHYQQSHQTVHQPTLPPPTQQQASYPTGHRLPPPPPQQQGQPLANYGQQPGTPSQRYQQAFQPQPYPPAQQQPPAPMTPVSHPSQHPHPGQPGSGYLAYPPAQQHLGQAHSAYPAYQNGNSTMPHRSASPQVGVGTPQMANVSQQQSQMYLVATPPPQVQPRFNPPQAQQAQQSQPVSQPPSSQVLMYQPIQTGYPPQHVPQTATPLLPQQQLPHTSLAAGYYTHGHMAPPVPPPDGTDKVRQVSQPPAQSQQTQQHPSIAGIRVTPVPIPGYTMAHTQPQQGQRQA